MGITGSTMHFDFAVADTVIRPGSTASTFTNPLYRGADPWVAFHDGFYYYCQASHLGVEVWKSPTLIHRGERRIVWHPPRFAWNSRQVWAPELHRIENRWYIYYAASDGYNSNHRMGVLECTSDDPTGSYIDRGQLYTGDDLRHGSKSRWAIDGTVLQLRNQLYFVWSGWQDDRDVQHLYIASMSDPCTIASERVRICANNCHDWECVANHRHHRGLHEAPQVIVRNNKVFLVYSCSGSWQPSYKLGMLHMSADADPIAPQSWTKHPTAVFESTREIFGVGHCCFTRSPDGAEDWMLYHSKVHRWDGWTRVVRAQRFTWDDNGLPRFGHPVSQPICRPSEDVDEESAHLHGAALPLGMAASPQV